MCTSDSSPRISRMSREFSATVCASGGGEKGDEGADEVGPTTASDAAVAMPTEERRGSCRVA